MRPKYLQHAFRKQIGCSFISFWTSTCLKHPLHREQLTSSLCFYSCRSSGCLEFNLRSYFWVWERLTQWRQRNWKTFVCPVALILTALSPFATSKEAKLIATSSCVSESGLNVALLQIEHHFQKCFCSFEHTPCTVWQRRVSEHSVQA